MISCTKEEKVELSIYNLVDVANAWWKVTREILQQELGEFTPILWVRLKEVFYERFFPLSTREAKAKEFTDMK